MPVKSATSSSVVVPIKARRRTTAGYARGEETRQRIIEVAIELFGQMGYEPTSVRDIAAKAAVNSPVLHYYFDGKDGLYVACVEYMHKRGRELLQPVLDHVRQKMAGKVSRDGLIELVCFIYERAAEFLLTTPELETWTRFMGWERNQAVLPVRAEKLISQGLRLEFQTLMCDLVGRITGKGSEDVDTRIRVLTLGGQLAIFDLAHQRSLKDIGWSKVDPQALRKLQSIIHQQTVAALRDAS